MSEPCPLVSVIIPVFNNQDYIESCIQSVVSQSYHNLEIIVVNDGSTDNSRAIIEKCASVDLRIIQINKRNEGLPLARQSGLAVAKGKYIQHLDSDDALLEDAILNLVRKAEETHADIVAAPFYICYQNQAKKFSGKLLFDELSGTEYLNEILSERAYFSVWSNFQKRSLFLENKIEVVPHIYYGEDVVLMTQLLVCDPKVVSISEPILNYNRVPTSITGSVTNDKYKNYRAYQIWLLKFFENKRLSDKFGRGMALLHLRTTFTSISWNHLEDANQDIKQIISDLKRYPDLKNVLSRRQWKIISLYKLSSFLGWLNLIRYKKQGKL